METLRPCGSDDAPFIAFYVAGECRQQVTKLTHFVKMSKLGNFITIFGITMRNAFHEIEFVK